MSRKYEYPCFGSVWPILATFIPALSRACTAVHIHFIRTIIAHIPPLCKKNACVALYMPPNGPIQG